MGTLVLCTLGLAGIAICCSSEVRGAAVLCARTCRGVPVPVEARAADADALDGPYLLAFRSCFRTVLSVLTFRRQISSFMSRASDSPSEYSTSCSDVCEAADKLRLDSFSLATLLSIATIRHTEKCLLLFKECCAGTISVYDFSLLCKSVTATSLDKRFACHSNIR